MIALCVNNGVGLLCACINYLLLRVLAPHWHSLEAHLSYCYMDLSIGPLSMDDCLSSE